MVRPREHDERTAEALLTAAERLIEEHGVGALSLRELAEQAGTTTRAVYSLFGSKEGLLGAMGARAFALLQRDIETLPSTRNPRRDLVDAALMFRRFALDHPALFSVGIQRADPTVWPLFSTSASGALAVLHGRFEPLADAGLLVGRGIPEAALQFHALCEGLAALELRGRLLAPRAEEVWRNAFHALITGFADPLPRQRSVGAASRRSLEPAREQARTRAQATRSRTARRARSRQI